MRIGYLIAEVDGPDVTPIGVYDSPETAMTGYIDNEIERLDADEDHDEIENVRHSLWRRFTEEHGAVNPLTPTNGYEVRFEHTETSCDIQITAVEVYL